MGSQISVPTCTTAYRKLRYTRSRSESFSNSANLKNLDPMVWGNLSEDILVQHILPKLSFTTLLKFCVVSRDWRNFILNANTLKNCHSSKSILTHTLTVPLRILNTSIDSGRWDNLPPPIGVSNSRVLAAGGGLICLSTKKFGELIIWNPITKRMRTLQVPMDVHSGNILFQIFRASYRTRSVTGLVMPDLICAGNLRVGMNYSPRRNHYRLILTTASKGLTGTTLIYDSRTNEWSEGPEVPKGSNFILSSIPSQCGRYFYCAMRSGIHNYLLELDIENQGWCHFRIPTNLGGIEDFIEHRGMILLVTRPSPGRETFSAFELHIGRFGSYAWKDRTNQHMAGLLSKKVYGAMRTREKNVLTKLGDRYVQCFGKGDMLFFVGTSIEKWNIKDDLAPIGHYENEMNSCHAFCNSKQQQLPAPVVETKGIKTYLRVWVHDTSTDTILHLTDWDFESYDDHKLLCFQLFTPSLSSQP